MDIRKNKSKWNILCKIKDVHNSQNKGVLLSFTTIDYRSFILPDGHVTDFDVRAELLNNYSNVRPGIYTNKHGCCLIEECSTRKYLYAISYDWEKLTDFLNYILSSAGVTPRIVHPRNSNH